MSITSLNRTSRWTVPVTSGVVAVVYLVAGLVGGSPTFAWGGFAIMIAFGLGFVLLGRRSETVKGLLDHRDERINGLDRDATAVAGVVLILTDLVLFVVEISRGRDGEPYSWLAAVAGGSYLVALAWLRWRR